MKKILFLAWLFTMCYFAAQAQNTRIGFTAGTTFANYKIKITGEPDNGNSKTGITAGVLVDIPFSGKFSCMIFWDDATLVKRIMTNTKNNKEFIFFKTCILWLTLF